MKLPKVESKYPEDPLNGYSWISIRRFAKQEWFQGFAYDWIKRTDIDAAMALPPTPHILKDWEDDPNLHELQERIQALKNADGEQATLNNFDARSDFDRDYTAFHARRIATLVKLLRQGEGIQPVSLDITYGLPFQRYSGGHGCSYINNGHHRIAALQYEGFKAFPAYAQGVTSEIRKVQLTSRSAGKKQRHPCPRNPTPTLQSSSAANPSPS